MWRQRRRGAPLRGGARLALAVERRPWPLVGALLVLLLLAGGAYCLILGDHIRFPDERDYVQLGQSIADSGTYSLDGREPSAHRPPVYPLLMAGLIKLGGGIPLLRLANPDSRTAN